MKDGGDKMSEENENKEKVQEPKKRRLRLGRDPFVEILD